MVELPLVLAGPVLRWAEKDRVRVWITLSKDISSLSETGSTTLVLEVYGLSTLSYFVDLDDGRRLSEAIGSSKPELNPNGVSYVKAGPSVHAYVLEAIPVNGDGFPLDEILAYEVYLVETNQRDGLNAVRRSGLCEHLSYPNAARTEGVAPIYTRGYSDECAFVKSTELDNIEKPRFDACWRPCPLIRLPDQEDEFIFPLPTFVLQGQKEELRLWVGSCLKPHGAGQGATAAMYCSEDGKEGGLLSDIALDATLRPHLLAQIGDQIYADDVPFVLADCIRRLYPCFMPGEFEELPPVIGRGLEDMDWHERRKLVGKSRTGATPLPTPFELEDGVENQLFTGLEFLIYYLMYMNVSLWGDLAIPTVQGETKFDLKEELQKVLRSRQQLLDHSTVMANMPVYCLLDDHEVTDDLFFDFDWIEEVSPSEEGHQVSEVAQYILCNAIFAYQVMQCFGGRAEISLAVAPTLQNLNSVLNAQLDLDYSFFSPTRPSLLFLDSRVARLPARLQNPRPSNGFLKYEDELEEVRHAYHKSVAGKLVRSRKNWLHPREALRKLLRDMKSKGDRVVILTPSPVLASDGIAQSKRMFKSDASRELDEEGWRDNFSNYFMLIDALMIEGIEACTIVSGDVHYGYAREAIVEKSTDVTRLSSVSIEQIVASPLLNEFERSLATLIKWFASQSFNQDYRHPAQFLAPANPEVEHSWVVVRSGEPPQRVAPFIYKEILKPIEINGPNNKSLEQPIWDNHFFALTIGKRLGVECHIAARNERRTGARLRGV